MARTALHICIDSQYTERFEMEREEQEKDFKECREEREAQQKL